MVNNPPISFLVGSGFSQPAGYPLATHINARFVEIRESDFSVNTNGDAWFHNGNPNPNDWFMRKEERLFVERILSYYSTSIATPSSFHYETFYDWYKELIEEEIIDENILHITQELDRDYDNMLLYFDIIFNQLIAGLLHKNYCDIHHSKGPAATHAQFLDLIQHLGQKYILHFHSLNHDLFFECLSHSDAMQNNLADGFSELDSPYYGKLEVPQEGASGKGTSSYTVRLPKFADNFDANFNLYKLHGSVDHYVIGPAERATVKVKWGVDNHGILTEVNTGGSSKYERNSGGYYPSFLSGTTYKTRHYNSTQYFESIINHFKHNLSQSLILIVIGYGFKDSEINRIIKDYFLTKSHSRLLIVDTRMPEIPPEFQRSSNFFDGGVSNFNFESLLNSIPAP